MGIPWVENSEGFPLSGQFTPLKWESARVEAQNLRIPSVVQRA